MSESLQLRDPLFKLILRFSNGETIQHLTTEPLDSRKIEADTHYAVVTSVPVDSPNELAEVSVVNLRDVTYIKTERVTLEQLATDRRMAGIRSTGSSAADDKAIKAIARINFI